MGISTRIPIFGSNAYDIPKQQKAICPMKKNQRGLPYSKKMMIMDKFRDFARPPQVENL